MEIIESLEELVTKDLSGRGVIRYLLWGVKDRSRSPLKEALDTVTSVVSNGSLVVIVTGFRPPPKYVQESDGPLGAAALTRVLRVGLGAKVLLITDGYRDSLSALEESLSTLGIDYLSKCLLGSVKEFDVCIEALPTNELMLKLVTTEVANLEPVLTVFIERVGPNYLGVMHSMGGLDVSAYNVSINELHSRLVKCGSLSIGIGDGGNEVGMGVIEDVVRKYVPYGSRCLCPCMGGIACSLRTDVLIPAAISNWGAYALAALIAKYLGREELVMKPHEEVRGLRNLSLVGVVDGVLGISSASVDSVPAEVSAGVVSKILKLIK